MGERGAPQYPINLYLDGMPCVVIGAGPVAAGKIEGLLACGAQVTTVAPGACGAVEGWAESGTITWRRKPYEPADLDGAFLVVTATADPEVDRRVFRDAEERRVLCNSADDPANCRFTLPSIVRRGDITVAISTRGRSPAMSAHLRRRLASALGPEYEPLLELLAGVRDELRAQGVATEPLSPRWAEVLDSAHLHALVREGRMAEARALLLSTLQASSA